MFPKTRNIESSFRLIRMTCVVLIVGCILFSAFVFIKAAQMVEASQSRVYILASGKALEAFASDRKENLPVEARDHIATFHQDFFSMDPDEKVINANITKALYLADASAQHLYENLKESGYYGNIISANISQRISIDSISLDMNTYPFHFRCYATQTITRTTSITTRDLVSEGWLRNTSRSDHNPHGFLIERWAIVENKDLKVETR
ncbi:MAG TPA: conjugative transposon protein TraK [Puia sp.]|nr:conjugative transposon protein TraK [Puia sp.]